MPLKRGEAGSEGADHRIGLPLRGDLHLVPADLRPARPPRRAAGGLGEQLRAETDREERHPVVEHRGEEVLLEAQPGVAILLVGVHRAAEGEDRVVLGDLQRWPGAALGEHPLVQLDAALAHLLGEHAGPGIGLVDDRENPHRGILPCARWKVPRKITSLGSVDGSTEGKRAIETDQAPAPIGPYSQAVEADGVLYCSGQVPLDPATGELVDGGIAEQARRCLENLDAVCRAAGARLEDAARIGIYVTDMALFAELNEVYASFFSEPFPVRTTVGVASSRRGRWSRWTPPSR